MSNLPIQFEDKVNSPELLAYLQQFGEKSYLTADEINQIRDAINELAGSALPDAVLQTGPISITGLAVSIAANAFGWRVNQQQFLNPPAYSVNLTAAADGFYRADIIVGTSAGTYQVVQGNPSTTTAFEPNAPEGTIRLAGIVVFGTVVGQPTVTPTTEFVQISESDSVMVSGSGVINQLELLEEKATVVFNGSVTRLNSISYAQVPYKNKTIRITNLQTTPVTLGNSVSGFGVDFVFPDNQDYVLAPKETIEFSFDVTFAPYAHHMFIGSLANVKAPPFGGSIIPTSTPTGTGATFWIATQAGTYTNFGGVVVAANSLAVISRNAAGVFSISQTTLNLSNYLLKTDNIKIEPWSAKPYLSGSQSNHIGKDWVANADTLAGDVPGTSSKWVERLDALLSKNDVLPISKKLTDNLSNITFKNEAVKLVNGGFYNYKTGVYSANANFAGLSIPAAEGDIFSFKGAVGFSALAAISFFDSAMNNIGYIFGDNTSTVNTRDTGIIMCPKRTATVIFGAYIAGGVEVEVFKYNLNTFVDSVFTKDVIDVYNKVSVLTSLSTTNDGVYNRNGILLVPAGFPTATNYKYTSINVVEGDIYNYTSVAFYGSNVFGILMLDVNNNILERRYTTGSFAVFQDFNETFVIPKNCKKILVNLKKNDQSKISKLSITADKFLTQQDVSDLEIPINYVNAWDYRFRSSISSDFVNSGFTYDSVNKVATATVANSYLLLNKNFKTYKRKHLYYLKLNATTVVEIGSSAVNNSVTYQSRNSLIILDIPNLTLKIIDINTLNLLSETSISGFIAGDYSVEIIVNDLTLTAVLRNNNTLSATTVSYTSTPELSPQGKLIDFPALKLVSGSVSVISTQIFLIYKPLIVFVGDSITESGYRVNSYAQKLLETDFGNNGTILAKGGANHDVLIGNTLSEIIKIKPQFLSILIGTNGGFISSQISAWKTFCDANDIKLIINVIPISNNETTYPYLTTIDNIITADNYGARFDLASSINNVVANGQNTSLFGDALHPNDLGHTVLRNRFIVDVKL